MKLTPAELAALQAVKEHGPVKVAAHALGKSPWTLARQLASARVKLDVTTTIQAAHRVREDESDIA